MRWRQRLEQSSWPAPMDIGSFLRPGKEACEMTATMESKRKADRQRRESVGSSKLIGLAGSGRPRSRVVQSADGRSAQCSSACQSAVSTAGSCSACHESNLQPDAMCGSRHFSDRAKHLHGWHILLRWLPDVA
ncbi:hypothetical protein NK6_4807 [Bradyrhizobium diazoefficiens]|uniref:Uncharacterized protein n=1 Tax=Bradyrhizobium diazoefficiens TaxID=1355477 RepID=A0A0E4BQZ3_9BRAD|nr:hypothetical protein NK6_4807 [Bradyrhizobium diazoefficiens]